MVQPQLKTKHQGNGKIYNFMEYKKLKPFFKKPTKISVGNPINDSYFMVKNLVYNGKQILALKKSHDPNTIVLVEAEIEDGQLIYISMIPDDSLQDISKLLKGTI